jgi:hypothetical protein
MQIVFKTSVLCFMSCFLWVNNPLMAQIAPIDTLDSKLQKTIDREWQTYGIPGIVLQTYYPDLKDSIGSFRGISVEYLIAAWIHQNENKGPSHGRFYAKINFMKSSQPKINDIFYMALGLNLSLERNPKRHFLIPFFGLEVGNMNQRQFGNVLAFTPIFGAHIYSSPNVFVNFTGGYVYPSKYLEELRGYTMQLGVNLSFW